MRHSSKQGASSILRKGYCLAISEATLADESGIEVSVIPYTESRTPVVCLACGFGCDFWEQALKQILEYAIAPQFHMVLLLDLL